MKNGFTETQNQIIDSVREYLESGDFRNAVVMTSHDLGFNDWYVEETYISWKMMQIVTK